MDFKVNSFFPTGIIRSIITELQPRAGIYFQESGAGTHSLLLCPEKEMKALAMCMPLF